MIYAEFMKRLLDELERERDMTIVRERINAPEALFDIKSTNDKLYIKILRNFEMTILRNVDRLIVNLCKAHNTNISIENLFDMTININGRSTALDFKTSPSGFDSGKLKAYLNRQEETGQPLLIVFLLKDSVAAQESLRNFTLRAQKFNPRVNIEVLLFEELIEMLFGYEEKLKFLNSMNGFREEMHEVIGYQITEICSSKNRLILRENLLSELESFDYSAVKDEKSLCAGAELDDNSFREILNSFRDKKLYKLLVGNGDFAESFITSEWLYKKYFTLKDLDNTFIVSGYLKSIEQLLWDVIRLLGNGRKLKNKIIAEENYDSLNKALGSLEQFFAEPENLDLFRDVFGDNKEFVVIYLKSQISDWRRKYRNGYLHKEKLNDKNTIESVRKETIYLYMLILGSIELSEEHAVSLMG